MAPIATVPASSQITLDNGVTKESTGCPANVKVLADNHDHAELDGHVEVNGFAPFQINGIGADRKISATGLKDDIVLLSWLVVLLRTREGAQVDFDWAYAQRPNGSVHEPVRRRLTMDEVIPDLRNTIGQSTTAVSQYLSTLESTSINRDVKPASLILSTSVLERNNKEIQDEGILHIEVTFQDGSIEIHPLWFTSNMLSYTIRHYVGTLAETIQICLSTKDLSIQECLGPTPGDLNDIWQWNRELPPTYNFCMHEMVAERAREHPQKVGISSWDGDLTYAEIDQYSSFIACSLRDLGVKLHDFVPICFEKSRWTIVAVLAAMKAGATFVLMDPSLPLARLQNMAKQVHSRTMITSRKQQNFSSTILEDGNFVVVEQDTFKGPVDWQAIPELPAVPATALMYLIFTSGSTGTPKGVKISHQTYTSSAIPRSRAVGYNSNSRVLDFASYAFDVSIDSMLLTLGNGGCLCTPSDEDRMNDINEVIRNMRINYAGITPSVARILDPDVITSLEILGLGGEAASARDVNHWGKDTRIVIGYGPCECTIGCTINSDTATGRDYISIGHGNGANIWIVDPNDHEKLVPVGAVGELLVEGPIVGQGYLDDPEKTASVFIKDPNWLVSGHHGTKGRRGRLYKSGDLGKYDPDGSGDIIFAGRKDTQVKLRGQRVELGEIESQLKARLPSETHVVAEVIVPQGAGAQPTLVAFIASHTTKSHVVIDLTSEELPEGLRAALSNMNADLAKVLPRYMVPTAYVPVNHVPLLISGKIDRKRLKAYGASVDLRDLDDRAAKAEARDLNELELKLRQAWSQTLRLDAEIIGLEDNFFALGGDSLAAMRLVTACRSYDLELTVAKMFNNPTLCAMAGSFNVLNSQQQVDLPAFLMISQPAKDACIEAAKACGVEPFAVEDIYPCNPEQESLFTLSLRSTEAYIAQRVACIPSNISLDALKSAWESVVTSLPILRTRVAQLQEPGLQQVVVKERLRWRHASDLSDYLKSDREDKVELGKGLARYAIVDNAANNKRYMVWTIHHVLYDGWSEPLILQAVSETLQGHTIGFQAQMKHYIRHMLDIDHAAMKEYWRNELEGAVGPQFPKTPSRDFLPSPDAFVERQVKLPSLAGSAFTLATLVRGAWALVASQYTESDDVVFGETLTGRDISLPGVEGIVGPLLATVPVRIRIDRKMSVESYLQSVQRSMLSRTPYQHMGWQNIRKVSADAQYASEAGTGLVIQPDPEYVGSELGFEPGDVVREALNFNPYPLMVAFGITKNGLRACASFDSSVIEVSQMERMLAQLEAASANLMRDLSQKVEEVPCISEAELDQIWEWNQTPPLALDYSSHGLCAGATAKSGSVYPPAIVPWVCDSRNPAALAPIEVTGELWLEGNCLSGAVVASAPWLVAGSSSYLGRNGKLQATGDLVRRGEDGSIIFVGRKKDALPINGHAVDIAEIETHVLSHLPRSTRSAVAFTPATEEKKSELFIVVEQPTYDGTEVRIMPDSEEMIVNVTSTQTLTAKIQPTISAEIARGLKKLDKFVHESLPSCMAPSGYIVIDRIPTASGQTGHSILNQLVANIPRPMMTKFHTGLKEIWSTTIESSLTTSESVLRMAWSKILRIPERDIDVDDNFFRMGGDSVLAMKLAANLRSQGFGLTVADIFRHMRLSDAAKVMKAKETPKEVIQSYKPFSTVVKAKNHSFLSEFVKPQLTNAEWAIQDVCSVTDSQALDIRATIDAPRTSIQYTMLYMDNKINSEKLLQACGELIRTHDILRSVFINHEDSFLQVIVKDLKIPVEKIRVEDDIEKCVKDLCLQNADSSFKLGSPFLQIYHVESSSDKHCLVIRLSHAQYDGVSLPALLQDLEILYIDDKLAESEPFPQYIARTLQEDVQAKAVKYWTNLLKGSSLSTLVGSIVEPTDKALFQHKPVDISARPEEITTASLLTAAWAVVLARHLQKRDVTFGSITSGRNIESTYLESVQGPCYQFTPVRVVIQPGWTSLDLMRFVQSQATESAPHDFLGFRKIAEKCTQWPSTTRFFDSIVHHQDWGDYDEMPFGGSTSKVDILNPHGDAPYPLKVVSFVQGGQTQVGVVGSERDPVCVDAILDELAVCVQELSSCRSDVLMV